MPKGTGIGGTVGAAPISSSAAASDIVGERGEDGELMYKMVGWGGSETEGFVSANVPL